MFGNYEGYVNAPYQILGIMIVVFAGFLLVSSLVFPQMYSMFETPDSPVKGKLATSVHAEPEMAPKVTDAKAQDEESPSEEATPSFANVTVE